MGNRPVHGNARKRFRGVVVRLAVYILVVVVVRGDHHVLAGVVLNVGEASVLGHILSLRDALFQHLLERRAIPPGSLLVRFVHLVRVALSAVEDPLQLALVVERVDDLAINKMEGIGDVPDPVLHGVKNHPGYKLRVGDVRVLIDRDRDNEILCAIDPFEDILVDRTIDRIRRVTVR